MLVSATLLALFLSETALAVPADGAPRAPESRTFVGEILQVDVANRKVVVVQGLKTQGKAGAGPREVMTVHVPFSTRVVRGTKAATLTDLKPRDHAVVRYRVTAAGAQALSLQVAAVDAATSPSSPTSATSGTTATPATPVPGS